MQENENIKRAVAGRAGPEILYKTPLSTPTMYTI